MHFVRSLIVVAFILFAMPPATAESSGYTWSGGHSAPGASTVASLTLLEGEPEAAPGKARERHTFAADSLLVYRVRSHVDLWANQSRNEPAEKEDRAIGASVMFVDPALKTWGVTATTGQFAARGACEHRAEARVNFIADEFRFAPVARCPVIVPWVSAVEMTSGAPTLP